ncbi:MAG: hypothetical protein A2106_03695 [Planctomycetes bacterium GWF2_40_8]|nr:MAG: hypothetical protein A2106_03695 [Planctomycetes bacterium GWF2_40_8]
MKHLMYRIIIITLVCLFLIRNPLNTGEHAYGKDNVLEHARHAAPDPYLLARNTAENNSYISEDDIIITIDKPDKEAGIKTPEKVVTENRKEEKEEKKKSSHSHTLISEYLEKGKKFEARNELSDLYFAESDNAKRLEIKNKLDELNAELVFSRIPSPDAFLYEVTPGDTLNKIASKFDTNYELIMCINKKVRTNIRVGERLKILNGKVTVLVDKSDFTLTLLLNGYFIKQFPIGIGKSDKTPRGVFVVDNKLINPVWYSPDGIYQFGDPKNVLGTRWIGFEDQEGLYGYGIHGTTEPETIGKEMSNGCIRLRNEDVEELFNYVKAKTEVVIQE